jgi:uncharacterized protein DUF6894
MPRYYFHFSDGKHVFSDSIGLELTGLADVRDRVIKQIRTLKSSQSERRIQEWTDWKMKVVDANGNSVIEVGFELKPTVLKSDS